MGARESDVRFVSEMFPSGDFRGWKFFKWGRVVTH